MTTAERTPVTRPRQKDLVKTINGRPTATELGREWLRLLLLEIQIRNNDDPQVNYATNASYMEGIRAERKELGSQLPGGNNDKIKAHVFSILGKNGIFPWQINHLSPGNISPKK